MFIFPFIKRGNLGIRAARRENQNVYFSFHRAGKSMIRATLQEKNCHNAAIIKSIVTKITKLKPLNIGRQNNPGTEIQTV